MNESKAPGPRAPNLFGGQPPVEIVVPVQLPTDPDDVGLAAAYARSWQLPLRLVNVNTPGAPSGGSLGGLLADLRGTHPRIELCGEVVEAETAVAGIRQAVSDRSLVFLASRRGSRWFDDESVGEGVVQAAARPVVLHGRNCEAPTIGSSVIVPVDGTRLAEIAVKPALEVAAANGAVVIFVTVTPAASVDTATDLALEGIIESEQRYLHQLTSRHGEGPVDVRWEAVNRCDPVAGIDELATDLGSSLIVAATHAESGVDRRGFGSVCMGLVEHGRVPVMIIPPESA